MTPTVPPKAKPWLRLAAAGATALAIACSFTAPHEGRLYTAYPDPGTRGAPWTICDGHTKGVHQHDTATQAQCDAWLQEDEAEAQHIVRVCVGRPMPAPVEASLMDFTLNVGSGRAGVKDGFCVLKNGSYSTIRRMAMVGNWSGVCAQFNNWLRAGNVKLRGLKVRREDATELCNWPAMPAGLGS